MKKRLIWILIILVAFFGAFYAYILLNKGYDIGPYDWSISWGGSGDDFPIDIACDDEGNAYIIGTFQDTVDFDPGDGAENRTAASDAGSFLQCFDSDGQMKWVVSWYASEMNPDNVPVRRDNRLVYGNSSLLVAGSYTGELIFNPTGEFPLPQPNENMTGYIARFSLEGVLEQIFEIYCQLPDADIYFEDIETNSNGEIFVCGTAHPEYDFDPGPGVANLDPIPTILNPSLIDYLRVFTAKYQSDGSLDWVRSWDAPYWIKVDLVADEDGSCVLRYMPPYETQVDHDPGPGTFLANGYPFGLSALIFLDKDGNFKRVKFVPGLQQQFNSDSDGNLYLTGAFSADKKGFLENYEEWKDTGPAYDSDWMGLDISYPYGAQLCKFSPAGELIWVQVWESVGSIFTRGLDIHGGIINVGGSFYRVLDLDCGPGKFVNVDNGVQSDFIANYDIDGNFLSGTFIDDVQDLYHIKAQASSETGSIFITGPFVEAEQTRDIFLRCYNQNAEE
jgi:hypothetical protein